MVRSLFDLQQLASSYITLRGTQSVPGRASYSPCSVPRQSAVWLPFTCSDRWEATVLGCPGSASRPLSWVSPSLLLFLRLMAGGRDFPEPTTASPCGMHGMGFEKVTVVAIWRISEDRGYKGGWQCIEPLQKPKKGWCKADDENWKCRKVFRNFQPLVMGWMWNMKDSYCFQHGSIIPRWMDGGAVCWDGKRTQFGERT